MRKIVQLDEYEYNKLAEVAKFNEAKIEEKAIAMWQDRGVAEIKISVDTGTNYNDNYHINCKAHVFYKDEKFQIPFELREKFREIIQENIMWNIEQRFGGLKKVINKLNQEKRWISHAKFILYIMSFSGWAVATVLFLMR